MVRVPQPRHRHGYIPISENTNFSRKPCRELRRRLLCLHPEQIRSTIPATSPRHADTQACRRTDEQYDIRRNYFDLVRKRSDFLGKQDRRWIARPYREAIQRRTAAGATSGWLGESGSVPETGAGASRGRAPGDCWPHPGLQSARGSAGSLRTPGSPATAACSGRQSPGC